MVPQKIRELISLRILPSFRKLRSRPKALIIGAIAVLLLSIGTIYISSLASSRSDLQAGLNPFVDGSDEVKNCIKEAIDEENFNAIVRNERPPTDEESKATGDCATKFGARADEPKAPTAAELCGITDFDPEPVSPPRGSPTLPLKVLGIDHHLVNHKLVGYSNHQDVIKNAKEIGANMIVIGVPTLTEGNKTGFYYDIDEALRRNDICLRDFAPAVYGELINEAHRNGLFVELRQNQGPPEKTRTLTTSAQVVESYVDFWTEVAKIAQKYHVYQVTAYGELDSAYLNAFSLATRVDWEDFGGEDITPLAQQTLAEIKKHYTGRVGVGIAEPLLRQDGLDIEGFDYLQFSYYPQPHDNTLSAFYAGLPDVLSVSREIADKNGIKELIWGETGTIDDPEKKMPEAFGVGFLLVDTKTKLDFYDQIFEQTKDNIDGYLIDYTGFFGIKGHAAEKVVQKWFNNLR